MLTSPLLFVSPKNLKEAIEAIEGGADIIDVKNPKEGALGANFPWVIKEIRALVPSTGKVSATIGDVPDLPGTCSLAAFGAAQSGADIVKVGLLGPKSVVRAIFLMKKIVKSVKGCDPEKQVVAAGYADAYRVGAIAPMKIPKVAAEAKADFAMLDTAIKDGKRLFDHLSNSQLRDFVATSHNLGLKAALAGQIKKQDIRTLCNLGVDVIGVRSAVCIGDRVTGTISRVLVKELKDQMMELSASTLRIRK